MQAFDYIIVGAGAAGCVLANRLSVRGDATVLVLESGAEDRNPFIRMPAGFVKTLYGSNITWRFESAPSEHLDGRRIALPQGRVLGGSSSINGMVYNRGQRGDFDTWAQMGNRGWGFDDLLPYFNRSERRIGGVNAERGQTGETPVTDIDWHNPLCEAFLNAAAGAGYPRNGDYNSGTQFGSGYYQRFIEDGRRVSAADAFLRPALKRSNVTLRSGAHVTQLLVRNKRVRSVSYTDGAGKAHTINANVAVVLSAGAVNSPRLLQLSGIGPAPLLQALGVPVVHNLSGVGENLRDHYSARIVARAKDVLTINEYARWPLLPLEVAKWLARKPSVLGLSPSIAYVHARSHPGIEDADMRILFTPGSYKDGQIYVLDDYPGMTCGAAQPRPESHGHVRIVSSNPLDMPEVQPNYLRAEADQRITIAGIRLARTIMARPEMAQFFECETLPGPQATSDDELLDFARRKGNTGYHLVGTCKMGPSSDANAVVDDKLKVHGLEGLRVVDASIMPMLPSANTYAATLAIAEKASDLIQASPSHPG